MIKRIVCIGDSLTYGFGVYADEAWPYISSRRLGIECINKGQNGDCTSGMSARFERDVLALEPEAVMILGGSNDILNGWPISKTMSFISEMVDMSLKKNILVFIGIPMCVDGETMKAEGFPAYLADRFVQRFIEYREILIRFCEEKAVTYIDFQKEYPRRMNMEGFRRWYTDGVHPTREGYHMMAEIFCDGIKSEGK